MMTVPFTPEDVGAVEKAILSLEMQRRLLDYWNAYSTNLGLVIDDLVLLRDRMRDEQRTVRDSFTTRYAELRAERS